VTRFLQGLTLRERSLLPVLQPRLPGPFERPESPVEPGWHADEPAASAETDIQAPAVTVAVVPQPVAVPLVHDVPPVHRPALAQPALLPRWTPKAKPAPRRGHIGESRRAEPAPARLPADPVDERRSGPPPPARQALAPRAAQVLPAADRPDETRPPAPPAQGSLVDAEPRRLLVPALVQQVQASPPLADGHDAAALPAGPTVHVSIGRVEVRAAAPAAAPVPAMRAKAPARAPSLSLNDYLQQRGAPARRSSGGTGGAR
jgi:hypothetical protein